MNGLAARGRVPVEGGMLEWPLERRARLNQQAQHTPFAYAIPEGARVNDSWRPDFRAVVAKILEDAKAQSDAKVTLATLQSLAHVAAGSEGDALSSAADDLTLVLACIEALRQQPTAGTWEYLWSLAWHSGALTHDLPRAVVAAAVADAQFKSQFLDVAVKVVEHAVANPHHRAAARERSRAKQLREDWKKAPQLSKLWWGVDHYSRGPLGDHDGVFGIVANLDLEMLMHLLVILDDPHAIDAALLAAGVRWSFARWQALVKIAPTAFEADGTWNGSAILPILLFLARDQLHAPPTRLSPNASDDELREAADQILELVEEISKTIAIRWDALPCTLRWTAWLMRQAMAAVSNESRPFPADARSRGYADATLIEALIKEVPLQTWTGPTSHDAELWEPWCNRCVFVQVGFLKKTLMPPVEPFLDEWFLTPEDWDRKAGQSLRMHAGLFETFGQRADAYGFRLLAVPLAEVPDPCEVWDRFWNMTLTLREIVEFRCEAAEPNEEWRGRSEASGLMRVVFGLGLMMIDYIISPNRELQYDRPVALRGLLSVLAKAVTEMSSIDQFDRGYWSAAMRHLAIRRAVWLSRSHPDPSPSAIAAFEADTKPTLADFLGELAGDSEGLLGFLEVALRNRVDRDSLKRALVAARIDLHAEVTLAERLLDLAPRRVGIGPEQLASARSLLN
jgi:hypothetical protein